MWARIIELMLAAFLSILGFILPPPPSPTFMWTNNLLMFFLMTTFALLSYSRAFRKIHLITFLLSIYLMILGLSAFSLLSAPHHQAYVTLGILLAMFSVIPSHASTPPDRWQEFERKSQ